MKERTYTEFEQSIRDALQSYEVAYDPAEWHKLNRKLNRAAMKSKIFQSFAVAVVVSLITGSILLLNQEKALDASKEKKEDRVKVEATHSPKERSMPKSTNLPTETSEVFGGHTEHGVSKQTPNTSENSRETIMRDELSDRGTETNSNSKSENEIEKDQDIQTVTSIDATSTILTQTNKTVISEPSTGFAINVHEICVNEKITVKLNSISKDCIYRWDFGDGMIEEGPNPAHEYKSPGIYNVSLTAIDMRTGETYKEKKEQIITVHPLPVADFTYGPCNTNNYLINPEMQFTNLSSDAVSWQWSVNGAQVTRVKNPVYTFRKKGTYHVKLKAMNQFGCASTKIKAVQVMQDYNLLAPNGFSPNGDGLNDTWIPYALKFTSNTFKLQVIDPSNSSVIFESSDPGNEWNGRIGNGIAKPGQVFVWIAIVKDNQGAEQKYSGTITIIK